MSSGASSLAPLERWRDDILQAELGALLHNLGKLSRAFLARQRCNACSKSKGSLDSDDQEYKGFNYEAIVGLVAEHITSPGTAWGAQDWKRLEFTATDWLDQATNNFLPEAIRQLLQQRRIRLPAPLDDRDYAIGDFIEFQDHKWYRETATSRQRILIIFPSGSRATELLDISHDAASGAEKEGASKGSVPQYRAPLYRATVFGHETPLDESQIEYARDAVIRVLPTLDRALIRQEAEGLFALGVGDTQWPINDVSLWDLSASTAALYKAAVARVTLDSQWVPWGTFTWRLAHIRFDGLRSLEQVATIGDLLGRQAALQSALDGVRELLEVIYPLGNEVYRDENGSAFVVPALDGDDDSGTRLHGLIDGPILNSWRQSKLAGELWPEIHITRPHQQAAYLHQALAEPLPPVAPCQDSLREWWASDVADVCTACGVRPEGWGAPDEERKRKAQARHVCYVCLERRGQRAQEWAQARHETGPRRQAWERTIWLDEVADKHGRIALVVGRFDLHQWLNGDMVQTLLAACDPAKQTYAPKNPSFARLQRVWRTTQRFWQAVQGEDIPAIVMPREQRLAIEVSNADELDRRLGGCHVYDAEICGRRLSVVWDNPCLLTADNLTAWKDGGAQALRTLLQPGTAVPLFEPGGYGERRRECALASVAQADILDAPYSPIIPLLSQPASFMALVPATAALEVATRITQRYEREMSKVCNRLPLLLGLVFFDRRQPLFGALDAGRRLLERREPPTRDAECTVASSGSRSREQGANPPRHLDHPHFRRWQELELTSRAGERWHWRASTVMGDGETHDEWYPYVQVVRDMDGQPPAGRQQFSLHRDENEQRWVHVRDVQDGDVICFAPSRFTWLFLDTSTRRFEAGREVYPLEELERIRSLWKRLQYLATANRLSDSQLQAVVALLAAKRQSWGACSTEFEQLAQAVLQKEGLDMVTQEDLTSRRLEATFELHCRILKRRLKGVVA